MAAVLGHPEPAELEDCRLRRWREDLHHALPDSLDDPQPLQLTTEEATYKPVLERRSADQVDEFQP